MADSKQQLIKISLLVSDLGFLAIAALSLGLGLKFKGHELLTALHYDLSIFLTFILIFFSMVLLIFMTLPLFRRKQLWINPIFGGFSFVFFLLFMILALSFYEGITVGPDYFKEQCNLDIVHSNLKKVDTLYQVANQDLCKTSCLCKTEAS